MTAIKKAILIESPFLVVWKLREIDYMGISNVM